MKPFFFMQLADPQFGMFARWGGVSDDVIDAQLFKGSKVRKSPPITGFADESRLFTEAIAEANRLKPAFVVVCGDMVNDPNSESERAEVLRVSGQLDPSIPIHWVPGNHDVGADTVSATPESIRIYREAFGPDYFAFQHNGASFLVLDSITIDNPKPVPGEWDAQLAFVQRELSEATARGGPIIAFSHHPAFLKTPNEPDDYWNWPLERREPLLQLLRKANAKAVFAGHWHRNNYSSYGDMQVVASGPVGYPLGDDPSGYRIVKVHSDRVEHDYYAFGNGPGSINL
ncbi:MAG: phosphoesterase [Chloroflexi bacterium]|nr:phosphoesterase [Chloroflexota bacterium]